MIWKYDGLVSAITEGEHQKYAHDKATIVLLSIGLMSLTTRVWLFYSGGEKAGIAPAFRAGIAGSLLQTKPRVSGLLPRSCHEHGLRTVGSVVIHRYLRFFHPGRGWREGDGYRATAAPARQS
jgi:hypothetical protein